MEKKRPLGVTMLAILAVIAGILAIYYALRMFGIIGPSSFIGQLAFAFFGINWLGAILYIILALIWFWVARMLWNLDAQGWLFVVVLSTLNLILGVISWIAGTPFEAVFASLLINGLILLYGLLPGTKEAFDIPDQAAA